MHNAMKRRAGKAVAAAVVMATLPLGASPRAAADDKLPAGEKVMDNFIKSTGGKRAYKRIKNRVMKASIETPQGSMTMKLYEAAPNKGYVEIETPMGSMTRGTDGDVVWRVTPMGAQVVTGDEREQELQDAVFNPDLDWRKIYTKAVCEEITEFAGESCYRVTLTPKIGKPQTRYYAVDTGLNMGSTRIIENPMAGEIEMTVRYDNYKEVDGILYPHKIVRSAAGQEGAIVIDSIEHNVDMPKDRFALPASVAELVADQAGADAKGDAAKKKDSDE